MNRKPSHNKFTRFGLADSKDFATPNSRESSKIMDINCSFFGIACRTAALSFLVAGSASLLQAQQSPSADSTPKTPLLMASSSSPTGSRCPAGSSQAVVFFGSDRRHRPVPSRLQLRRTAPSRRRRRYGRPNYSDSHSNPDGSSKFAFMVGPVARHACRQYPLLRDAQL